MHSTVTHDVRYKNEHAAIKDRMSGFIIKIERPNPSEGDRDRDLHSSETVLTTPGRIAGAECANKEAESQGDRISTSRAAVLICEVAAAGLLPHHLRSRQNVKNETMHRL